MDKELLELLVQANITVNAAWPDKLAHAQKVIAKVNKNTTVDFTAIEEFFVTLAFLDLEKSEIEQRNLINNILNDWENLSRCIQTLQTFLYTPRLLDTLGANLKQKAFLSELYKNLTARASELKDSLQKVEAEYREQQKIKQLEQARLEQESIEQAKIIAYPGYQTFKETLQQLSQEKQGEINAFISALSKHMHPTDEKQAWGIIQPFLSELIAIKKGKNGVESLPQIATFIKKIKTLFSPVPDSVIDILRETVGRELLQAAYPSRDNVVVVRLWLTAENMKNAKARQFMGVETGGHVSIQIYNNAQQQNYFSFVTEREKLNEPSILGRLAKKMGMPAGADWKGTFDSFLAELDAVYFAARNNNKYVGYEEVQLPIRDIGVEGLSAEALNRWVSDIQAKAQNKNLIYNFYDNNCSTLVANGLEAGGAEGFKTAPVYLGGVKTPIGVFAYAQTVAEAIKQRQENADTHKKQNLLKEAGARKIHKKPESVILESSDSYLDYTNKVTNRQPMTTEQFVQEQAHIPSATLPRNTITALTAALNNADQRKELLFDIAFLGLPLSLEINQKNQTQLLKTLNPKHLVDPTDYYQFKKALLNDAEAVQALTKNTTNRGWVNPLLKSHPDLVKEKLKPGFWSGLWQRIVGTDIRQAMDVGTLISLAKRMFKPEEDLIDVLLKKPNIFMRVSGQPNYRDELLADKTTLREFIEYFIEEQPSAEVLQKIQNHIEIEKILDKEIAAKVKHTIQAFKLSDNEYQEDADLTANTATEGYSSDSDINDNILDEQTEVNHVPKVKMK